METKLTGKKIGDEVKRIPQPCDGFYHSTEIYTIVEIAKDTIRIEDSNGMNCGWWDGNKFEVVISEPDYLEQFRKATKLIGKKVSYKNGYGTGSMVVTNVFLVSKESPSNKSRLVYDYLETHEFCVVCTEYARCIPFENVVFEEYKELKISDEYTAKVYEDKVVVGGQTIPLDKVKEIIKLAEDN